MIFIGFYCSRECMFLKAISFLSDFFNRTRKVMFKRNLKTKKGLFNPFQANMFREQDHIRPKNLLVSP